MNSIESRERRVVMQRTTGKTAIAVVLHLDGTGAAAVSTGLELLDHMIASLARHARVDLELRCKGDLRLSKTVPRGRDPAPRGAVTVVGRSEPMVRRKGRAARRHVPKVRRYARMARG
jgi:hypothetical protein